VRCSVARLFWTAGAVGGFLGVAGGAFGAHALAARLPANDLQIWETGARYLLVHAVLLMVIAGASHRWPAEPRLRVAGVLTLTGMTIFTGTLWALCLSGLRVLGAITPIGGLCLLGGWLALGLAGWRCLAAPAAKDAGPLVP